MEKPVDEGDPIQRVRFTCETIARNATQVHINGSACKAAASFLLPLLTSHQTSAANTWLNANGLHPSKPDDFALKWIFVIDTLNFCFWTPPGKEPFTIEWKGKCYTGYWALCAAVNRALEKGIPLLEAEFLANVDENTLAEVFRSSTSTDIPLLEKRVHILNESGQILLGKFQGTFLQLLSTADWDAVSLVKLLIANFPSFCDEALYKVDGVDRLVAFYKRAQILVADCWACCRKIKRIEKLTMFADYRVPQCLVQLGVLEYREKLMVKLKRGELLENGSKEEVEIRACSIIAVERVKKELEIMMRTRGYEVDGERVNSVAIDFELWTFAKAQSNSMKDIPIHRTLSIFY